MPGKTPHGNGKEPVENGGIRNSKDVEMKDEAALKGKKKTLGGAVKEGEDEVTVVVPPSKAGAAGKKQGDDGDVAMADDDASADKDDEAVKVDPVVQTSAGTCNRKRMTMFVYVVLLFLVFLMATHD